MTVVYSPRSRRDLEKIRAYIAADSESPADRFVGRVLDACEMLKILPERFAAYPYGRQWRMMPFGNYLVFFQSTKAKFGSAISDMPLEEHLAVRTVLKIRFRLSKALRTAAAR